METGAKPPFDSRPLAVIDVGTTSVRMAIAQVKADGRLTVETVNAALGHDADALGLQLAHHGEQLLDLVLAQRGSRLVEHQQPHVAPDGLRDGNHLLVGPAQPLDGCIQRQVKAQVPQGVVGLRPKAAVVQRARQPARRFLPQHDVFCHGEVAQHVQVLVDHRDTEPVGLAGIGQPDVVVHVDHELGVIAGLLRIGHQAREINNADQCAPSFDPAGGGLKPRQPSPPPGKGTAAGNTVEADYYLARLPDFPTGYWVIAGQQVTEDSHIYVNTLTVHVEWHCTSGSQYVDGVTVKVYDQDGNLLDSVALTRTDDTWEGDVTFPSEGTFEVKGYVADTFGRSERTLTIVGELPATPPALTPGGPRGFSLEAAVVAVMSAVVVVGFVAWARKRGWLGRA